MVTKKKQSTPSKRNKVKTGKLTLSKETVKELTHSESDKVQAGAKNLSISIIVEECLFCR